MKKEWLPQKKQIKTLIGHCYYKAAAVSAGAAPGTAGAAGTAIVLLVLLVLRLLYLISQQLHMAAL